MGDEKISIRCVNFSLEDCRADPVLARLARSVERDLWDDLVILADRLEEVDQDRLAKAFRWLAREQKVPMRYLDRWTWAGIRAGSRRAGHYLPKQVMQVMKALRGNEQAPWNSALTLFGAYWIAAEAIASTSDAIFLELIRPNWQDTKE